jgi:4-amino-4-deoxy-L-arabinose transferase-like glycosyltransferase
MKKVLILGAALVSALAAAVSTTASAADGNKHFGNGHGYGNGYRPAYVAPAHGRGYYAPARGYWSGGRWIAPVVVGGLIAAAVGGAYAYNNYDYPAPVYVAPGYAAPSYYAPAAVTYAAPARTGFDYADANGDGYISFEEAAVYPHWQRNFGNMDRNRDGYLTRDEVAGWRYR